MTRRDGDTVKAIYSKILFFTICFFTKGFFPRGPNSSPHLRFTASSRRRVLASVVHYALVVACILFPLILVTCGYHFAGTGGQPPGDIHSIAIDVLENKTAEIGLETIFTNAIINEFVRWKRLPVKSRSGAEAVLGGSIANIKTEEVSHIERKKTFETRVTVTLALTLKRNETGEILWQKKLSYYDEYVETGSALNTATLRRQSFNRIAEFLAEKIHLDIFEQF